MKYIIVFILFFTFAFGMKVSHEKWEKGKTFSDYLELNNISADLLKSISKEDQKFLSEINRNYKYYELKDDTGIVVQSLIPISKEMQIHLFKKRTGSGYGFDIIPIKYKSNEYFAKVIIEENPYLDTIATVQQPKVAERISKALKGSINTKKLHKGDELVFIYTQRTRLGEIYAMPDIQVAKIQMGKKEQFIYVDEDGYGYKETAKSVPYSVMGKKKVTYTRRVPVNSKNAKFGMPLRHARITSGFSYRRYHPILKRYRPHHGTDFGARRGTPLLAVNSGKVIYSGRNGSYGKVVKIKHPGGYVSLYAHLSRTRAKKGQKVKKGQVIGYVGSTGRSTGPHLHFGLKKNGRWVNPMKVLRKKSIKTTILKKFTKYEDVKETKYKKVDIKGAAENRNRLLAYLKNDTPSYIWGEEQREYVKPQDKEVLDSGK